MTQYTNFKRAIQKLGFRAVRRSDGWTEMENGVYRISIKNYSDYATYHANRMADGMPVFWKQFATEGIVMYTGNDQYHYDTSNPSDGSIESAIGWAAYMAGVSVEGNTWPTS